MVVDGFLTSSANAASALAPLRRRRQAVHGRRVGRRAAGCSSAARTARSRTSRCCPTRHVIVVVGNSGGLSIFNLHADGDARTPRRHRARSTDCGQHQPGDRRGTPSSPPPATASTSSGRAHRRADYHDAFDRGRRDGRRLHAGPDRGRPGQFFLRDATVDAKGRLVVARLGPPGAAARRRDRMRILRFAADGTPRRPASRSTGRATQTVDDRRPGPDRRSARGRTRTSTRSSASSRTAPRTTSWGDAGAATVRARGIGRRPSRRNERAAVHAPSTPTASCTAVVRRRPATTPAATGSRSSGSRRRRPRHELRRRRRPVAALARAALSRSRASARRSCSPTGGSSSSARSSRTCGADCARAAGRSAGRGRRGPLPPRHEAGRPDDRRRRPRPRRPRRRRSTPPPPTIGAEQRPRPGPQVPEPPLVHDPPAAASAALGEGPRRRQGASKVTRRNGRLVATVDLRKLRQATFTVSIEAVDLRGRTHRETRRYRTCRSARTARSSRAAASCSPSPASRDGS